MNKPCWLYRSRLRRFVTDARPSLHIIVLPYGHKTDLLRFLVQGTYLVHEVRHITYSLRAYAVEKPRSTDGPEVYASLGPSMTTVPEIKKSITATRKHHIFAYFCLQGTLHVYMYIALDIVPLMAEIMNTCMHDIKPMREREMLFKFLVNVQGLSAVSKLAIRLSMRF